MGERTQLKKVAMVGMSKSSFIAKSDFIKRLTGVEHVYHVQDAGHVPSNMDLLVVTACAVESDLYALMQDLEKTHTRILLLSERNLDPLVFTYCLDKQRISLGIQMDSDMAVFECMKALRTGNRYLSSVVKSAVHAKKSKYVASLDSLSILEQMSLYYMVKGESTMQIANRFDITEGSVRNMKSRILKQFDTDSLSVLLQKLLLLG